MSMNVNAAGNADQVQNGGVVQQGTKEVELRYEDGILTFTEEDGEKFDVKVADLSTAEIDELTKEFKLDGGDELVLNQAKADAKVDGVDAAADVAKVDAAGTLEENQAKLDDLQGQWNLLNDQATAVKEQIEKVSEEIKKAIDEIVEEQDEITEDEKERVKTVIADQVKQFKKDKENGKDVTLDGLEATIKGELANNSFSEKMSSVLAKTIVTNSKMVVMDGLLNQLQGYNADMKALDGEIANLKDTIATQEIEKAQEEAKKCCDPIGFVAEDGTKYEFVVDRDNDNKLDDFSEFLGAEGNYQELLDLDTDGKNGVTLDELKAVDGLKVLVTNADGSQEMKSLQDAFGDKDINIDTDNFQKAAAGSVADNGQELLGNFNIKIGDNEYEGYSTLDSADYLKENYQFESENPEVKANVGDVKDAAGEQKAELKDEQAAAREQAANEIDTFIDVQTDTLNTYKAQMQDIERILGFDEEIVKNTKEFAEETGMYVAEQIIKKAEQDAEAKKAEEDKKAAEEDDAKVDDKDVKVAGEDKAEDKVNEEELDPDKQLEVE